jgi:hypothetical protein
MIHIPDIMPVIPDLRLLARVVEQLMYPNSPQVSDNHTATTETDPI